jgi:hypothetical protein
MLQLLLWCCCSAGVCLFQWDKGCSRMPLRAWFLVRICLLLSLMSLLLLLSCRHVLNQHATAKLNGLMAAAASRPHATTKQD